MTVISHGLWQRLYGRRPERHGESIEINGQAYRIVGVAPEGFLGLNQLSGADLFVPIAMYPQIFPAPAMVERRGPCCSPRRDGSSRT